MRTPRNRWVGQAVGTLRRSVSEWEPSPEVTRARVPLHLLLRSCVLAASTLHADGPLRSPRGRRVALGIASVDAVQSVLLGSGRFDTPRGRILRSVLESAEVAAMVLVYPDSGKDSGIAAALLPATGVAVEQSYTGNPVKAALSLTGPTLTAYACRRLTRRPTSFADVLTWPMLALGSSLTMRVVEQVSRERLERRETRRRATRLESSFFLGWRSLLKDGGGLALDDIQHQFSMLLTSTAANDASRSGYRNAQQLRQAASVDQYLSPGFSHTEPSPSLLAVAFQQYELIATLATNMLDERVFLEEDVPVFSSASDEGAILLNENQVSTLWDALDAVRAAGGLHAEVIERNESPAGYDVRLRVTLGGPDDSIKTYEIPLPCLRAPWQLELVTAGLLVQIAWRLSVSSPGHAHVPLRVTLGSATADLLAAGLAESIARRWPGVNRADLAALCIPGSLLIATLGTRTMRRKTYNPDGTPMHPGLHVLAGNGYLLASQVRKMSPVGRAAVAAGISAQLAASWYFNRREPGDGRAFAVELLWSVLGWSGSAILAQAADEMAERVNAEQNAKMADAAAVEYVRGWDASLAKITEANEEARRLLVEAVGEAVEDGALGGKAGYILEKNEIVRTQLAEVLARRSAATSRMEFLGGERDAVSDR